MFIRWAGRAIPRMDADLLRRILREADLRVSVSGDESQFEVAAPGGEPVLDVDIARPNQDGLFEDDQAELLERLREAQPDAGARHASGLVKRARAIATLTPYWAEAPEHAGEALEAVMGFLVEQSDGVSYLLDHGFSNRHGHLIAIEADMDAEGVGSAALVDGDHWATFALDLADPQAVAAFREGRRPRDAEPGRRAPLEPLD